MEMTKARLKQIIKEEILNLAELDQIGQLSKEDLVQLQGLLAKASPEDLKMIGVTKDHGEST